MVENRIGVLIVIAVAIIVGLVLLTGAANNVANSTTTTSLNNHTVTLGANGSSTALPGYQGISGTYTVYNGTTNALSNVTVASSVSAGGIKQLYATVNYPLYAGNTVNITAATVQPDGYIDNSAGRAIAGLIIIFGALAIAVIGLAPVVKENFGV